MSHLPLSALPCFPLLHTPLPFLIQGVGGGVVKASRQMELDTPTNWLPEAIDSVGCMDGPTLR